MIELGWDLNRARLWMDNLPDWSYPIGGEVNQFLPVSGVRHVDSGSAAIELLVPAGGRAYYGALGATFRPEHIGRLEVRVSISQGSRQILNDSLAGRLDTAYIGLIPEYSGGVLEGVVDVNAGQLLGAGRLQFCQAVHGAIGSSEWLFRLLGHVVTRLLILGKEPVEHESLIELLQHELHNAPH